MGAPIDQWEGYFCGGSDIGAAEVHTAALGVEG